MTDDHAILITPDGSRTAHNARFDEAYGSRHGADTQAHHVFLGGTQTDLHPAPRVLEIGFGVAVNFRATLENALARGIRLEYLAYEFDPVSAEVLAQVAAGSALAQHPLWQDFLARWARCAPLREPLTLDTPQLRLTVHFEDVLRASLPPAWATALYLDGFSPAKNPEVWTPEFVARLAAALAPGGVLATYSAAGHVRRSLQAAGLRVERREGARGKRECLRAVRGA